MVGGKHPMEGTSAQAFDWDGFVPRRRMFACVVYEADSEVTVDAFHCLIAILAEKHTSFSRARFGNEDGTYPAGSLVWMNRETTHTPEEPEERRSYLVLWPEGVKRCLTISSEIVFRPPDSSPSKRNGPAGTHRCYESVNQSGSMVQCLPNAKGNSKTDCRPTNKPPWSETHEG